MEDAMRGPDSTLADIIEGFRVNNEARLAPRTMSGYLYVFCEFDRWIGGGKLRDLNPENVNRFAAEKMRKHAPAARLSVATLKALSRWCQKAGITPDNALASVSIPRVDNSRDPFTDEEQRTMLKVLAGGEHRTRARDRAAVLVLLSTGLRLNELRELDMGDVHIERPLDKSYVLVRRATSKSRENRMVRLDAMAATAVHNYVKDWRPEKHGPLFLTEAGKPFTYSGFGKYMGRISDRFEAAGIRDWMAHRCRHTWATDGHRMGMTLVDLESEGGWKSGSPVPFRYTKSRPFAELQRIPTALSRVMGRAV